MIVSTKHLFGQNTVILFAKHACAAPTTCMIQLYHNLQTMQNDVLRFAKNVRLKDMISRIELHKEAC